MKILFFQWRKMCEKLTIKYFPENEFAKEPYQASEDAAGYDVFASEAKTICPKTNACIRLDFKMAIPKGSVEVMLMNHHPHDVYTVRTGDRTGQIVFMKKYDLIFEKVSDLALLGRTKCGSDRFGSTGSSGNKIFVSVSASTSVNDKVIIDSDICNINKIIIDSDLSESNDDDSEEID